jgi:hypothetical protein
VSAVRPPRSALIGDWVDHLVALGADRGLLEGTVAYWDDAADGLVQSVALTKDQLIAYSVELGGEPVPPDEPDDAVEDLDS